MGRIVEAQQTNQDVSNRLHSMQFPVTPEERQLLGITDEDIAAFSDEGLQLTAQEISESIRDIIVNAYDSVPLFKKLVDEDAAKDPNRLGRSSKVVSKLLKHLRGVLPVEKRMAVSEDAFGQAHDMIRDVLHGRLIRPAPPAAAAEPVIDPIADSELSYFGITRDKLTATVNWHDLEKPVLFFLSKLKDANGKVVKNEATKGMPDDLKIGVLTKLLNDIRKKKLEATGGQLSNSDVKWLGKDIKQLQLIAKTLVIPAQKKPDATYQNDLIEINSQSISVLDRIHRLTEMFNGENFKKAVTSLTEVIDTALPPASLFEDRIKNIQDEVSKLGLSKIQVAVMTDVNSENLSFSDPVKKLLDDQRALLSEVNKEITEKGDSNELTLKRTSIENQIKQFEDLAGKDTSALRGAIDDYLSTLRVYKTRIKESISANKMDEQPIISDFVRMVDQLSLEFARLAREQQFKARWAGRTGFMYRNEAPSAEAPVAPAAAPDAVAPESVIKTAGETAGYASKVEQFRGKGLGEAYKEIADILEATDKLPAIKEKILSILELPSSNKMNDTGKDYSGNPLGGNGSSLEDAVKLVSNLRALVKKIKIKDKGEEAVEVINWAAALQNHIKRGGKASKLAFISDTLRNVARKIIGSAETQTHIKYQSPANVGSDQPLKSSGKAGWLLFRERITKMGKKSLQSLFEEPTLIPSFIEEMERAGLSNKLLTGGKEVPTDIDKVLESVLQKSTGKNGDLGNILSSKILQKYRSEFDIKSAKKDLDEANSRVVELNKKISETEEKFLPKLQDYGNFIHDPIGTTRDQLESLRGKEKSEPAKDGKKVLNYTEAVRPERIDAVNYRSVLQTLVTKYLPKGSIAKMASLMGKILKQAEGPELRKVDPTRSSKLLPSDFMAQYQVWKKQLKDAKRTLDAQDDPYKRAVELEKYYTIMTTGVTRLINYFEYQDKVMAADAGAITGISEFLDSDEAKKEKGNSVEDAKSLLETLKQGYEKQKLVYDKLKDAHADIASVQDLLAKELSTVKSDIADKKVDMIYQVAISPELAPNKYLAQELKDKAKEHEKGLSFIIDRDTYKKNMNKLMVRKVQRNPHEWFTTEGHPVVLSPERKKEYEQSVKDLAVLSQKIKEDASFRMQEVALNRMKEGLEKTKKSVEDGNKLIIDYTALLQNIDFLRVNKDTMPVDEYNKQNAALESFFEGKGLNEKILKKDITREKEYLENMIGYIKGLEDHIEDFSKDLESKRSPKNTPQIIERMVQELHRVKLVGLDPSAKPLTNETRVKALHEKAKRLEEMAKETIQVAPGSKEEVVYGRYRKDLEHNIELTGRDIERAEAALETELKHKKLMEVHAGSDTEFENMSPIDKALETKGIKPAPFMEELKKPKGWEIVENFFNEVKREHNFLKKLKEEDKTSTIRRDFLKKRLDQLENMGEAIDLYKNQEVDIGGDPVVFRDVMTKFESTLDEYSQLISKYTNQRDDAVNRQQYLKQEVDHLNELFDPATGEFKGLDPEEISNIKGIFLRMIYRDLERYWATKVGKDLSVFGERDSEWYNNVFRTFKQVAGIRSNKKMLGLVNKYKQETRSDFDDIINRTKSQQLEKDRDKLLKGYEFFEADPNFSSRLKDLNTRIDTLKKQEKEMDRIFNIMGAASSVALQADFEAMLRKRIGELDVESSATGKETSDSGLKETKVDLNKKTDEETNKALDELEKAIPTIAENAQEVIEAEKDLTAIKILVERERDTVKEEVPESLTNAVPGRLAYDKNHRDFNLNILYGSHMQSKIAEMLSDEIV